MREKADGRRQGSDGSKADTWTVSVVSLATDLQIQTLPATLVFVCLLRESRRGRGAQSRTGSINENETGGRDENRKPQLAKNRNRNRKAQTQTQTQTERSRKPENAKLRNGDGRWAMITSFATAAAQAIFSFFLFFSSVLSLGQVLSPGASGVCCRRLHHMLHPWALVAALPPRLKAAEPHPSCPRRSGWGRTAGRFKKALGPSGHQRC